MQDNARLKENESIVVQDQPVQQNAKKLPVVLIAPNNKLRVKAKKTTPDAKYHELIDEMFEVMQSSNGIGLAATQLGVNERIIVMDVDKLSAFENTSEGYVKHGRFEMLNPMITKKEGMLNWLEGCLSVPGFSEHINRSERIEVTYLDRYGNEKSLKAAGLLSACIQHEIDHLDGILFIDRTSPIRRNIITRKLRKSAKHKKVFNTHESNHMTF